MAFVSTMILRSMRMIGEKARGATLTSSEQAECLDELNSFLDSCATERLLCYTVQQDSMALSQGQSTFSVGPGATFNITRPVKIVDPCFVRDAGNLDSAVTVIGAAAYGMVVQKSVGFTYPKYLFYDSGFSATSTGTISLYPSPSASLTLFINSWKALGTVSSVSQNFALPPGYQLFIESNFALHLAAGLVPVSAETAKIARDSKASIKGVNVPDTIMRMDAAAPNRGNILTGP